MSKTLMFALMLAVAAPVPALAQTQPAPTAKPARDPNRIICEKEEEIGTRLGSKKVCKTWLQWQQQRQEHRESIERIQQNTGILKSGA
jgi:hypothetical protein